MLFSLILIQIKPYAFTRKGIARTANKNFLEIICY
jgi:hypothetical protein